MHNHQRISRRPVAELLQKFAEIVVKGLHAVVGFGNQVLY